MSSTENWMYSHEYLYRIITARYSNIAKWANHVKPPLRHIHNYLAQDLVHYAKRVTLALVSKPSTLDDLPRTGKIVAELNDEMVREVSLYSYQILSEIEPQPAQRVGG